MSCYYPIDEDTLQQTAKALQAMNPGRASADHIRDMIRANMNERLGTYLSTAGWIAFTWSPQHNPDDVQIRVAIEPYTALKYIELIKG